MTTRYPKAGKGTKWTVKELESIPFDWNGDTLNDGGGLYGEVRFNEDKKLLIAFKHRFKFNGKGGAFYCGSYPTNTLATVRGNRDQARIALKNGVDPRLKRDADKIKNQQEIEATIKQAKVDTENNLTFEYLFEYWIQTGVKRVDNNAMIIRMFRKYAQPTMAKIALKDLTENHILKVLDSIFKQGKTRTAVMLFKDIYQMLRWAEKRKPFRALLIDGNPADLIKIENLIPSDYKEERDRVLSPNEIRALNEALQANVSPKVQAAVWLCLSTLCRIGELLMTEWSHVNFDTRTWYIPESNVKGTRKNKQSQTVYLSDFALNQFRELHKFTGFSKWAFPASDNKSHVCLKTITKQIGDRQIKFKNRTKALGGRINDNSLVVGDEAWTPHDLRRTGATMMQELRIDLDVIDGCQNHVLAGSKIRRNYMHYDYPKEKKEAWKLLGEKIQNIL